jgi:hypothetical protein
LEREMITTWLALLVSVAVACIAAFNWRTAHQKIVLDVFEKRFAVYEEIMRIVAAQIRQSRLDDKDFYDFIRIKDRAKFLFGDDVSTYLKTLQTDLEAARREERNEPRKLNEEQAERDVARYVGLHDRIAKAFAELERLLTPYMKIHEKADPFAGFKKYFF